MSHTVSEATFVINLNNTTIQLSLSQDYGLGLEFRLIGSDYENWGPLLQTSFEGLSLYSYHPGLGQPKSEH